jgi:archaemetzincin
MRSGTTRIYTASIGDVSPLVMAAVRRKLADVFDAEVLSHSPAFEPAIAFDYSRNQYNSTSMLQALYDELPNDASKLIGITDLDLFAPVFTFVFGEAQLGGRVALASSFRLRTSFYGLSEDPELLLERMEKEAVHEIGHTFGLVHCSNPRCVMHVSTAAEEVDLKLVKLCQNCRAPILASKASKTPPI